MGVPVIVGTEHGTEVPCNGQIVTYGIEIYVMCEIPSNVILADLFAEIFDERNPAVKKMIKTVIAVARAKRRKIGICGQAPSDYPEFAQFLVEQKIDSISLNPDTVVQIT